MTMPTGPALDYGSTSRIRGRRSMLPVLAGLALGAVCLVSLRYGERRLYYHDRDRVIAELSAIQGVHVITVDGPDDGWHMTVAYAWFSIGRDPNKTICLQAPKA
ncbi:MAG TPA: hypothetical protein VN541_01275, partial [Tepidisphaeraceae bacterium]|nr:hypothetical protein [Tepidisphaeraceae bacterium]